VKQLASRLRAGKRRFLIYVIPAQSRYESGRGVIVSALYCIFVCAP